MANLPKSAAEAAAAVARLRQAVVKVVRHYPKGRGKKGGQFMPRDGAAPANEDDDNEWGPPSKTPILYAGWQSEDRFFEGVRSGKHDVIVFHGTSDKLLEVVKAEGLKVLPNNAKQQRATTRDSQHLFVAADRKAATYFAKLAVEHDAKLGKDTSALVFAIRVPAAHVDELGFGEHGVDSWASIESKQIPPDWIVGYQRITATGAREYTSLRKEGGDGANAFAVILCSEGQIIKAHWWSRWPKGSDQSKGGEFAPKGQGDGGGATPPGKPASGLKHNLGTYLGGGKFSGYGNPYGGSGGKPATTMKPPVDTGSAVDDKPGSKPADKSNFWDEWESGAGGQLFGSQYGGQTWQGDGTIPPAKWKPAPLPKGWKPHPSPDDHGKEVKILYPSRPSHNSTWANPDKTAVFTPGSDTPKKLNGVAFSSWKPDPKGWASVDGTNDALEHGQPFAETKGKKVGTGVIIMEPDGRIWLTRPTNGFGGYTSTFPKGTLETGLTMQQNAIKEAYEETGLKVHITGVLGDHERDMSRARFYMAKRVGGTPKDMGWESQAMSLTTLKDARKLLNRTHDRELLDELETLINIAKKAPNIGDHWTDQPRWPAGTPLGGQWREMDGGGITKPPKLAGGLEGSMPGYQQKVNALYAAAQAGDKKAIQDAIDALKKYDEKWSNGQVSSSHVRYNASIYQYGLQLQGDMDAGKKAATIADAISGPPTLAGLGPLVGGKPGGSNPGGMYSVGGEKVLVKGNAQLVAGNVTQAQSDARAHNEVLASKLLGLAGAGAPEMGLVDLQGKYGGGLGVTSKMVEKTDFNENNVLHVDLARKDYAAHAWLANYDVLGMGYDNTVIVEKNGVYSAMNIDPGGALLFRAQGLPKGLSHGVKDGVLDPTAPEFETMRKNTTEQKQVFGGMTADELQSSAKKIGNISDDQIIKTVGTYGSGSASDRLKLAANLIARRDAIVQKAAALSMPKPAPAKSGDFTQGPTTFTPAPAPAAAPKSDAAPKLGDKLAQPEVDKVVALMNKQQLEPMSKVYGNSKTAEMADAHAKAIAGVLHSHGYHVTIEKPPVANDGEHLAAIESAIVEGDKSKLASLVGTTGYISDTYKGPAAQHNEAVFNYGMNGLIAQHMKILREADKIVAGAPKIDIPPKPQFATGFEKSDKLYAKMADELQAMHAAGNVEGLTGFKTEAEKWVQNSDKGFAYHGADAWKMSSFSGKKLMAYHAALLADLNQKNDAVIVAGAKAADATLTAAKDKGAPTPEVKEAKNLPAMPIFEDSLLADTNTNASSHNVKVYKIKAAAEGGDVKAILAMNYATNTPGKKQVKLANDALAALGSSETVVMGQKKGAHPALNGGVSPAVAGAAAKNTGTTAPAPSPSATTGTVDGGKKVIDYSHLDMKDAVPTPKPTFTKSSKAHVNEQNTKLADEIEGMFKAGNLTALKGMSFPMLDKETGAQIGEKPMADHPAKDLKAYWEGSIATMQDIANPPPPLKSFDAKHAKSIADVAEQFPAKSFGTTVASAKGNEKVGFWAALGKIDNPAALMPSNIKDVTSTDVGKAFNDYKKMGSKARAFISGMQGGGLMGQYRAGAHSYGEHSLKDLAKAAYDASQTKAAGTQIYRWQNMTTDMVQKLVKSGPGTVLDGLGPMCASWHPTATKHFGQHLLEIVYAEGARAIDSHGSGKFDGEKEISILPHSRFVLQSIKVAPGGKATLRVLMLPPDKELLKSLQ
ncbi:Nudix_Hydrolase domain containing protein [uncultured Caudovirales phage]|uniref:Nudix_Hydrolase domain containing protein n=1 Tax=uncultured Caudovirales phage TaxID=2100421 RepID=A0A6J5L8V8_9CAUD|nr:Nudix_Hydrolase domain containing protein [uncultured Caudovirales phage]